MKENPKSVIIRDVLNRYEALKREMVENVQQGMDRENARRFVKTWLSDWTQILPDDEVPFEWDDASATLTLVLGKKTFKLHTDFL